jgi:hypothetical protein
MNGVVTLAFAAVCGLTDQQRPGAIDVEAVRSEMKQLWESQASFEFDYDEFLFNRDGTRDLQQGSRNYKFGFTSSGQRLYQVTRIHADGTRKLQIDKRYDGKREHRVLEVDGNPGVVDMVITSNQSGTHTEYTGEMCALLWLILPGGQPLYERVGMQSSLTAATSGKPNEYRLAFPHKTNANMVVCVVSKERGWIPSKVSIGPEDHPTSIISVTKFQQTDGRWFPEEGMYERLEGGKWNKYGFVVNSISYNKEISETRFLPPSPNPGEVIIDNVKARNSIVGGKKARRSFEKTYKNNNLKAALEVPKVSSLSANDSGYSALIYWTLGVLGCAGLITAIGMKYYQK